MIDPERRMVVGRARLDLAIVGFAADGVAFGYDEGDEFEPVVVVVRLELPGRLVRTGSGTSLPRSRRFN